MIVSVRLAELCNKVETYVFDHNPTVREVFDAADKSFTQGCVTIDGSVVCDTHTVQDNALIVIGAPMKGNVPFAVTFIRPGANPPSVTTAVESGATIEQAIASLPPETRAQFYHPNGQPAWEFRFGGTQQGEINSVIPMSSGDVRIICTQKLKGNN